MATTEEEFSFPAITADPPQRFIKSPTLWQRSFSSTPNHKASKDLKGKQVQDEENRITLFSSMQDFKASFKSQRKSCCDSDDHDKEEKMDILWENFNDHSASFQRKADKSDVSSGKEMQMNMQLSKTNGKMVFRRKPRILAVFSALKKVFTMHNLRRSIKKRI